MVNSADPDKTRWTIPERKHGQTTWGPEQILVSQARSWRKIKTGSYQSFYNDRQDLRYQGEVKQNVSRKRPAKAEQTVQMHRLMRAEGGRTWHKVHFLTLRLILYACSLIWTCAVRLLSTDRCYTHTIIDKNITVRWTVSSGFNFLFWCNTAGNQKLQITRISILNHIYAKYCNTIIYLYFEE